MVNRYKVWRPPNTYSDSDVKAFDEKLEEEYQNGYKVKCSFKDVIIFEKFSNPSKTNKEIRDIVNKDKIDTKTGDHKMYNDTTNANEAAK